MCDFFQSLATLDFDIRPFFTALFGAFFGALAAYLFGKYKDKEGKQSLQYSALIEAQVILISQLNTIKSINLNYLSPLISDEERHTKLKKLYQTLPKRIVDIANLSFIAECGDPKLLLNLNLSQNNYLGAIDSLKKRNDFYDVAFSDVVSFDPVDERSTIRIPSHIMKQLKELTDDVYSSIESSINQIEGIIETLADSIKLEFPKKRALRTK